MLQMGVGALALLPFVWELRGDAVSSIKAMAALLVLRLLHTAWMYTLMHKAFKRLKAQPIAGLSFIYPVMGLWWTCYGSVLNTTRTAADPGLRLGLPARRGKNS